MSLSRFSIIVTIDSNGGISKNGTQPWSNSSISKFFRDITIGNNKNVVIMGKNTYNVIPSSYKPLENRYNIVISKTCKQEDYGGISIYSSLLDALSGIGDNKKYDHVYIIGGKFLFDNAVKDFLYLCDKIIVNKLKSDYKCDKFFPYEDIKNFSLHTDPVKTNEYTRFYFNPSGKNLGTNPVKTIESSSPTSTVNHPEYEYINLCNKVLNIGENVADNKNIFGTKMVFDVTERMLVCTLRKINIDSILKTVLWTISGNTDSKNLENDGVTLYKEATSKPSLSKAGLNYKESDCGPVEGFQYRHWGESYNGMDCDEYKGCDQLQYLITNLVCNPFCVSHILNIWNVSDLERMTIIPTTVCLQFQVSNNKEYLDCQVYNREENLITETPVNLTKYYLLFRFICQCTNYKIRNMIYIIGNTYIKNDHIKTAEKLIGRTPRPWPIFKFKKSDQITNIDQIKFEDCIIDNYTSCNYINIP